MKWFYNMGVRKQIMLGFILIGILVLIIGVTAVANMSALQGLQDSMYKNSTLPIQDIQRTSYYLQKIKLNTKDMGSAADLETRIQYAEQNQVYFAEIDKNLAQFERSIEDEEVRVAYAELMVEYAQIRAANEEVIELAQANQDLSVLAKMEQEALPLVESFEKHIEELQELKLAEASAVLQQSEELTNSTGRQLVLMLLGGAVIALGVAMIVSRMITEPVRKVTKIAETVAAKDLRVNVPQNKFQDEVGGLLQAFGTMVQNLRTEIGQIIDGVNILSTSLNEISSSTMQFNAAAAETDRMVSDATVTMEELKQTVKVSSQKANYIAEIVDKAVEDSARGQKAVEETVKGIHQIQYQMDSVAQSIKELSERSYAIEDIITTVDEIAEQTSILAVNAAIEAAKAGEQGKGFVVVAEEVKSLAGQSKQATTQVRKILRDIQTVTNSAIVATDEGNKAVSAGVGQAKDAGAALTAMTVTMQDVSVAVTQIATSSQQQYAGTEQATLAMENIRQASKQNLDSSQQLENEAKNLDKLSQGLKDLVQAYKL